MNSYVFLSFGAVRFFQIYGPPSEDWFGSLEASYLPLPSFKASNGCLVVWAPEEGQALASLSFAAMESTPSSLFGQIRATRRGEAFNRILRLIQATQDHSISIPALWRPFNADSLISIQAAPRAKGERSRLLFDRQRQGSLSGVCHGVLDDDVDLVVKAPTVPQYSEIQRLLDESVEEHSRRRPESSEDGAFELEATNRTLGLGDSLTAWYESKLTTKQRGFVDFPLSRSIRVRGPAGSGKTVALVVKVLRQLEIDRAAKRNIRYGLITHSQATVELIQSMLRTMVGEAELTELTKNGSLLYVGTLYSLAYELLGTELRGLQPLSLDGKTGREMQSELLLSVVTDYLQSNWVARKGGCSSKFVDLLEGCIDGDLTTNSFLLEILNEFSCILEPEGISRSSQKRAEYISKRAREAWRLNLSSEDERRTVLDLHGEFRKQMREIEAISIDQLIADFDRFLDSNAWELTREVIGFDATFVDELHSLNRMERMVITSLQKDPLSRPIVVMAEDEKQDVRRVSLGLRNWQQQLAELQVFDLTEVFRYTPQINNILRAIDDFAPTLNLEEDWPGYDQKSGLPSGPLPEAQLFTTAPEQYDKVFSAAALSAKQRKSGRAVAVLCCDYENFKLYLGAGKHRDLFFPVESREDITLIPSRGTRFVLSMPEFVAGLQFEEVYLVDVSASVLTNGESVGVRDKRRGLSLVYLGASRAMSILHISALTDAGGFPQFIQHAIDVGVCAGRP
ncbi:UvrD-helicase domain-containing protein [Burkholderia ubonensis]|uniref:UvrD-helicase domain-containing protein n=1 Tax=Burkholderia ubonensis TaxID=101571 RepID=UPI000ABF0D4D|nr:UvrD-helicase domain-containing protein [Burkholderia ubonensis]